MSVKWICDACGAESDEQMFGMTLQILDLEIQVDLCHSGATTFRKYADGLVDDMLLAVHEKASEDWSEEPDPEEA